VQEAYKIGNAQSIGSYQIQSSYFATYCSDCGCLAVLADGTADHINGRRCAVLAAEACIWEFQKMQQNTDYPVYFNAVAKRILWDMREIIFLGKTPYLSVSIQWLKNTELFYYSAGNNRNFLFDGSNYQILSESCGKANIRKGMTAGMISRGVWEALNEKELLSYLQKKEHPYDKAQQVIMGVKKKNRKMAGTAAVLLVEGCL